MPYHSVSTYDSFDVNGISKKDKLLKNKMFSEMLVLKDKFSKTMSAVDKRRLSEEYDKLYKFNYEINRVNNKIEDRKDFMNLSIREIIDKLASTLILIINDIIELYYNPSNMRLENILNILIKDDRMIYSGVILIIISILLFFIFTTK